MDLSLYPRYLENGRTHALEILREATKYIYPEPFFPDL